MEKCSEYAAITDLSELLSTACNSQPCESFKATQVTSECTRPCGGGKRVRSVTCTSSLGYAADRTKCPGSAAGTVEACNEQLCPELYWAAFGWERCSATCDGGVSERLVVCLSREGLVVEAGGCAGAAPLAKRRCNTQPCEYATWRATPFTECSSACGGIRTRRVECVASDGSAVPRIEAAARCPALKPANFEGCRACPFCDDPQQNEDCSRQGTCANEKCVCREGWTGVTCAVPSSCFSRVLGVYSQCCASGVLNFSGVCCEQVGDARPSLDANGECCAAAVDACGVCGGKGKYVDNLYACCEVRSGRLLLRRRDSLSAAHCYALHCR